MFDSVMEQIQAYLEEQEREKGNQPTPEPQQQIGGGTYLDADGPPPQMQQAPPETMPNVPNPEGVPGGERPFVPDGSDPYKPYGMPKFNDSIAGRAMAASLPGLRAYMGIAEDGRVGAQYERIGGDIEKAIDYQRSGLDMSGDAPTMRVYGQTGKQLAEQQIRDFNDFGDIESYNQQGARDGQPNRLAGGDFRERMLAMLNPERTKSGVEVLVDKANPGMAYTVGKDGMPNRATVYEGKGQSGGYYGFTPTTEGGKDIWYDKETGRKFERSGDKIGREYTGTGGAARYTDGVAGVFGGGGGGKKVNDDVPPRLWSESGLIATIAQDGMYEVVSPDGRMVRVKPSDMKGTWATKQPTRLVPPPGLAPQFYDPSWDRLGGGSPPPPVPEVADPKYRR